MGQIQIQHLPDATCSLISFLLVFFLPGSLNLYQSLVHWSRLASAFCCRLNRLVLDDRSKILTTSGERRDAQPVRERRRPDRSTGLRRLGCTIRQGESHGSQRWSIRQAFLPQLILILVFVCRCAAGPKLRGCCSSLPASASHLLFYYFLSKFLKDQTKHFCKHCEHMFLLHSGQNVYYTFYFYFY